MGKDVQVTITCDHCETKITTQSKAIRVPGRGEQSATWWDDTKGWYYCSWWCVSEHTKSQSVRMDDKPRVARNAEELTVDAITDDGFRTQVKEALGEYVETWFHYPHQWLGRRTPAMLVMAGSEQHLRVHARDRLKPISVEKWKKELPSLPQMDMGLV